MMHSRSKRFSLRRATVEQLEPRRLLAGFDDLPDGPQRDYVVQHAEVLSSPARYTLFGAGLRAPAGRFPKAIPSGEAGKLQRSTAATRIREAESVDPLLMGVNDIPEDAEHLPLGFGPGQVDAIDVRGSIEEPFLPGTVTSTEDDGSIPLANESSLISGAAVTAMGTIGDGPQALTTGDFDYFRIPEAVAGDLITVQVRGLALFDPAVAIYNSVGELMISNDDSGGTTDSYASLIAPEDDDYYVLILGSGVFGPTLPSNPFDPESGSGPDGTGAYEATIGLNFGDSDFYSMDLNAGDVFSLDMLGASNDVTLFNAEGVKLIGNRGGQLLLGTGTPLTSDGNATVPYVINEPGRYFVQVIGDFTGNYEGRFRLHRPGLEDKAPGTKQILFLDFDGETIDSSIWDGFFDPGEQGKIVTLSPLEDFLSGWGLSRNKEGQVIEAIVDVVTNQLLNDVRRRGSNGDFLTSRDAGDFGIEIRNSRDHADPYGLPNVSRVIVGGTVAELGIDTVGIAQSVDPGNFNTEETAVVLLDALSGPEFFEDPLTGLPILDPITGLPQRNTVTVNSYLVNEPHTDIFDLIGITVGSTVSHEAGHLFGNWHTDLNNDIVDLMDTGGEDRNFYGVGIDGILGTRDDETIRFGIDEFEPTEDFTGIEDTLNTIAFGLPTGRGAQNTSATGIKWNDLDGDGLRDLDEPGLADFIIYVDVDGNGDFGLGEPAGVTGTDGRYRIRNVPRGTFAVREVNQPGFTQTFPDAGEHIVTFSTAREASGVDFGNRRGTGVDMGVDYGDAPAPFPTLAGNRGPSHSVVPGFHLGGLVDGELNGQPTALANGDDVNDADDEDGVVFVNDLVPGFMSRVDVTVSDSDEPVGLLQAWIDFDGDGSWTSPGERIFTNRAVTEGVNQLTFNVPLTAVQGTTVARFRYGYEVGLSFTGASRAGEVEDHLVDIVRGGPTANDDQFNARRNSEDNVLPVTNNDSFRPGSGTRIVSVTDPSSGGTAEIGSNGLTIIYTPQFDFDGIDTFSYTLQDTSGATDSANVSVTVEPDLALIRLDTLDTLGNPITQIDVGQQFTLQAYVQDLRDVATGVFAAYSDVSYPDDQVSLQGSILFSPTYANGQSGNLSTPGLMDEVGAFDGVDRLGPNEMMLFAIVMRADAPGVLQFVPSPADVLPQHNVLLYDRDDAVPVDQIEYRGVELTVSGAAARFRTNPNNSLDVNDDRDVSPLDALLVINELNSKTEGAARSATASSYYLDVSGDGALSPLDALLIINRLNSSAEGESDAVAAVAAAVHPIEGSRDTPASSRQSASSGDHNPVSDGQKNVPLMQQRAELFAAIDDIDLVFADEEHDPFKDLLDL